jgi:hypothetical protein
MAIAKDNFIKLMSDNVQKDSNATWFNKLAVLFDHNNSSNLYGENIAHLILYANDRVRFNDVTNLLSKAFPESLFIIKCEHSEKGTVKANTDVESEEETKINKRAHYHCYITYNCKAGICIHKSFKSKVREMLKNKKSTNRYMLRPSAAKIKPIEAVRPWLFTGYNIVNDDNNYDPAHLAEWDVFYNTPEARRSAYFNGKLGDKSVVPITHSNGLKVMNWIAYATKNRTVKVRKNFIIVDNREAIKRVA